MKKNTLLVLIFFVFLLCCNFLKNPIREGQVSGPVVDPKGGSGGKTPWKVSVDTKGDLVFSYIDKEISKLTKAGEWSSQRCRAGMWNLRDSRIGIPGRGDINLHTDGWFRALNYNAPELTAGRHKITDYGKGGWAGRNLWYGGSAGGRLHRG